MQPPACRPHFRTRGLRSAAVLVVTLALVAGGAAQVQPGWTRARTGPEASQTCSMAYDVARQRVVLFGGGRIGTYVADTWEWDGSNWRQRAPTSSPGARGGHAMAYDVARQRVVLFGGMTNNYTLLSDTWEWDGNDWHRRSPKNSPRRRFQTAMAYDVARQRMVLFAGGANPGAYSDTWEWDGNNWTQRSPIYRPHQRYAHAMAYDLARGRIILFGGQGATSVSDTWEWDGNNWTQRLPTTKPGARANHAMAYDVIRQRVVLFGGRVASDTWEWDGNNWTKRSPTNNPGARSGHAMAYDLARQRVVLFGGLGTTKLADTWEWEGNNWTQRSRGTYGAPAKGHAMAYDVARRRVVLFSGAKGVEFLRADTWEWDGSNWTQRFPTSSPSARRNHAMAYDSTRRRVVLFGGDVKPAPNYLFVSDTWEWDGSNWTKRSPTNSPSARGNHAMAYDVARQRIVLFGGDVGTSPNRLFVSDTWEWDGSNWTKRSPTNSPSARANHAMAYDILRRRVVLFGGHVGTFSSQTFASDTWEWDGSNWTKRSPTNSPSPRRAHAMVYDIVRQRVVLFGGLGTTTLADTWEWDGKDWTRRSSTSNPRARSNHAMAYDFASQRVVLFGGWGGNNEALSDTWHYGSPATTQPFGTACSGSSSSPILTSDEPYIGHLAFSLQLIGARAALPCVFGVSTGRQDRPIPPCMLYLQDPILPMVAVTNWAGFARSQAFVLPLKASLHGLVFYAQALVADPRGPVGGVAFSSGLRLVVGD